MCISIKTLSIVIAFCTTALCEEMKAGMPDWIPWENNENGIMTGIIPDILNDVSKRTGIIIRMIPLPQNRMIKGFREGMIDIEPASSPSWRKDYTDISVYSVPYAMTEDLIIVKKGSALKGIDPKKYTGKKIACNLGYSYPLFNTPFKSGSVKREDALSAESLVRMLKLGRVDAILIEKTVFRNAAKKAGLDINDFETAGVMSRSALQFRLHTSKKKLLPSINSALEEMIRDGTIDTIMKKVQ